MYYFLPTVLLIYFLAPKKFRNIILLLASLFFYGYGEPRFLPIMLVSIFVGYFAGLLIEKHRNSQVGKTIFILSVSIHLGLLFYFKYTNFFIENVVNATGISLPVLNVTLPIGISFYTFQIVSYLADVYRGTVMSQRNFIALAAYITSFPQLIAGPIVRYQDVEKQLFTRTVTGASAAYGIRRFVFGLSKKVLLANTFGELCDIFRNSPDKSVLFFWLYAIAFTLHIYFDFSGYSDMAIGLGKILGFDFPENFNYPYISRSVTEFWRRWHMTLGSWFRDYLYIPLGGNRVSKSRWIFNIAIVWFTTGLWHGAAWNFILWGAFFAVLLVFEKTSIGKRLVAIPFFNRVITLFLIVLSFVMFNAVSVKEGFSYISAMFGINTLSEQQILPIISEGFLYYLKSYFVLLCIGGVAATPLPCLLIKKIQSSQRANRVINLLEPFILLGLTVLVTAYLVDDSFNPFLYFRF